MRIATIVASVRAAVLLDASVAGDGQQGLTLSEEQRVLATEDEYVAAEVTTGSCSTGAAAPRPTRRR